MLELLLQVFLHVYLYDVAICIYMISFRSFVYEIYYYSYIKLFENTVSLPIKLLSLFKKRAESKMKKKE